MARRLNCDLHLPTSNVECRTTFTSAIKLSTLQHEDFPDDSQHLSFIFLDDRTIGCKIDETRVHAPVMRKPLLVLLRTWRFSDGDGSDGCARRWTQHLARDRNLFKTCHKFLGTLVYQGSDLQHARIGPDSHALPIAKRTNCENDPCEMS